MTVSDVLNYDIPFESWIASIYQSRWLSYLELFQFIVFVVILYYFNPFEISTKYPYWTHFLVFAAAFIFVTLFYFIRAKGPDVFSANAPTEYDLLRQMVSTLIFLVVAVFAVKYILNWMTSSRLKNVLQLSLTVLFLIGALALLYIFFAPVFKKIEANAKAGEVSYTTFVFNLIMFIPCLLLRFLETLKKEFNITSPTAWTLLAYEALIVALYFVLPVVAEKVSQIDGIELLKGPVYLSQEHRLGDFQSLYQRSLKNLLRESNLGLLQRDDVILEEMQQRQYHYAVSGWFYINPQPPNTSPSHAHYTNIFDYAGKPTVQYNGATNSLRVMTDIKVNVAAQTKEQRIIVELGDIPLQSWNNIVINYDRGTMDVFFNGVLVGSQPSVAPYMVADIMTAGKPQGLTGGLCNVMYYPDILSESFVQTMYKTLRVKEFPVF